jgi:hypothetical protein
MSGTNKDSAVVPARKVASALDGSIVLAHSRIGGNQSYADPVITFCKLNRTKVGHNALELLRGWTFDMNGVIDLDHRRRRRSLLFFHAHGGGRFVVSVDDALEVRRIIL